METYTSVELQFPSFLQVSISQLRKQLFICSMAPLESLVRSGFSGHTARKKLFSSELLKDASDIACLQ